MQRFGQYVKTCHRDFRGIKHAWFATDGVRAANGKDIQVTAVGDAAQELHAWSAPVVDFRKNTILKSIS